MVHFLLERVVPFLEFSHTLPLAVLQWNVFGGMLTHKWTAF